jgi:hypothetical protein
MSANGQPDHTCVSLPTSLPSQDAVDIRPRDEGGGWVDWSGLAALLSDLVSATSRRPVDRLLHLEPALRFVALSERGLINCDDMVITKSDRGACLYDELRSRFDVQTTS